MRRVNSSSGSGCWDDTRTRLPKRRPRSTVGSAISATSVNTARSVATWPRAKSSRLPSVMLTA